MFLARISGRHEDEELIEKREALSRKERRKQMRAADPAVKLRAKAHDELRSRHRPGQHEDEESKDKRSRQPLKRCSSSRKERKKQRRAPDPAAVRLRAKADAAAPCTSSNSAAGEVKRGGLGGAQRHQDDQGGRRNGEQHLPQKRSRG